MLVGTNLPHAHRACAVCVCGGSLGAIPIMPRSVKPVIPYSTAMLCASIVRRTRHRYRTDECGQIFWSNDENYRRKVGGRSCSITLMGSMRWICSSCRQSRFACSMDCRSWGTADDKFYGLASQLIQLRSGSQIRSRKHAAGNRTPAISSVTGMGLMVRYSSRNFDQWAFATGRHRRVPTSGGRRGAYGHRSVL
jgi:hypothetical protein